MSTYIRQAQQLMKDAGYYTILIDGEFGKGSLKAVETMLAKLGHAPKPTVAIGWVISQNGTVIAIKKGY